jgi:acyl-homoserine lactone acylase PvdQ
LRKHYGRVDVPLGTVQRLRRGAVDLPLGGGPDVLNAAYTRKSDDGHLVGIQGDSYILIAAFGQDGVSSQSIHQYGASNRPDSKHYADQAPLFVQRKLKPALRREADIRAQLEREYTP